MDIGGGGASPMPAAFGGVIQVPIAVMPIKSPIIWKYLNEFDSGGSRHFERGADLLPSTNGRAATAHG